MSHVDGCLDSFLLSTARHPAAYKARVGEVAIYRTGPGSLRRPVPATLYRTIPGSPKDPYRRLLTIACLVHPSADLARAQTYALPLDTRQPGGPYRRLRSTSSHGDRPARTSVHFTQLRAIPDAIRQAQGSEEDEDTSCESTSSDSLAIPGTFVGMVPCSPRHLLHFSS